MDTTFNFDNPITNGKNVPRSPRLPDNSCKVKFSFLNTLLNCLLNLFIKKSRIKQNGEDMEDLDMPMLILFQINVQN